MLDKQYKIYVATGKNGRLKIHFDAYNNTEAKRKLNKIYNTKKIQDIYLEEDKCVKSVKKVIEEQEETEETKKKVSRKSAISKGRKKRK